MILTILKSLMLECLWEELWDLLLQVTPSTAQESTVTATAKKKIGEPSEDFHIRESVVYSHNYFERKDVNGEGHALCLMCQEEVEQAKIAGKSLPKVKQKKKLLKTPDATTKRK